MNFLHQPWPYLVNTAFIALMGYYAWRRAQRPGTRYFHWMVVVWIVLALAATFSTVVQSVQLRYGMLALQTFGALLIPVVNVMFSLAYTGNEKWLDWRILTLLASPALIFGLLVVALPQSSLTMVEMHYGVEVVVARDLVKWTLFAINSFILLINFGVLAASLLRAPAFRWPILLIILGLVIPRVALLAIGPEVSGVPPVQVSILFSGFSALAFVLAMYNFRLLRVVPVARNKAIDSLPFGLMVLDSENFVVDFNPAAQALPGLPGKLGLRKAADKALGEWWGRISGLVGPEAVSEDVVLRTDIGGQCFRVVSLPLMHISGWRIGQVFIWADITEERQAQREQSQTLWARATLHEREQLADELHDGISQSLAFLNLQAQAAQVYLHAGQSEAVKASLLRLTDAAVEVQEDTRELIGNLLAVSLPVENFYAALHQILAAFEKQTGLTVRMETCENSTGDMAAYFDPTRVPPPVTVQLIRITQEALTNVRKHAQGASQVSVKLKAGEGQVELTITDDGAGFDPAAQQANGNSFGLQIMRQRAARIGGQATVKSTPGKGTCIEVCVPLAGEYEFPQDPEILGDTKVLHAH